MNRVHPTMTDDVFIGGQFLMALAEKRDEEFKLKCQTEYNKTTKPDQYPSWEAYYKALAIPTESDAQSSGFYN